MTKKETLCKGCKHRQVCKFVNTLIELEMDITKIKIEEPLTVSIKCEYYDLDNMLNKR